MLKSCRMRNEWGSRGEGARGLEGEEMPKWGFDTSIFSCSALCSLSGTDAFLFCMPEIPRFAHRNNAIAVSFTACIGKAALRIAPQILLRSTWQVTLHSISLSPREMPFYPYAAVCCLLNLYVGVHIPQHSPGRYLHIPDFRQTAAVQAELACRVHGWMDSDKHYKYVHVKKCLQTYFSLSPLSFADTCAPPYFYLMFALAMHACTILHSH